MIIVGVTTGKESAKGGSYSYGILDQKMSMCEALTKYLSSLLHSAILRGKQ